MHAACRHDKYSLDQVPASACKLIHTLLQELLCLLDALVIFFGLFVLVLLTAQIVTMAT